MEEAYTEDGFSSLRKTSWFPGNGWLLGASLLSLYTRIEPGRTAWKISACISPGML
jgi:hypothetical protein